MFPDLIEKHAAYFFFFRWLLLLNIKMRTLREAPCLTPIYTCL